MPWRQEPMKDVGSCDKPRGAAEQALIPGISEWGNPPLVMRLLAPEYIGCGEATRGTETSKYPEERKTTAIP